MVGSRGQGAVAKGLNKPNQTAYQSVVDPGGATSMHPPRFFRFDIQHFRNVAASGVGTPP